MKSFCLALCIAFLTYVNYAFGAEAGMPQLNPEFCAAQIFWLILTFSVLYLIIWKIFLPRIAYSIENRKSKILNDLQETEKLKENAEKKLQEYNQIIESSKKDAKKISEDNKKKLDKDIGAKKQKLNEESEKELKDVEKEIKNMKKSSLLNINKIAEEVAVEVVKQIIDTNVNKSNVSEIVKDLSKNKTEKYL